MPLKYNALIGGRWVDAASGESTPVVNPFNGDVVGRVPKCGVREVEMAVAAAREAFPGWSAKTMAERSKVLLKFSRLIMDHREALARLETAEQGSPLRKSMNFDIPQCAEQLEYFAGVARSLTGETLPVGPWCMSATIRHPLGVIGLITPWNFPALMVVWKLGAALVTGNTCIVKPPSIAPLTTLKLGELAMEAGVPEGAFNVLTGPGEIVGEAMATQPGIVKVGFTGDTSTGKRIMALASGTVKQVGLELGGKNAFIVLPDADIDNAVEGAVFGAYFNSGQVCAAASRFYLHADIYDEFSKKFVAASKTLRMGDPMDMATTLGPVAYEAHRDRIEGFVERAKQFGATLLLGGGRPRQPGTENGFFVAPTVFGDCTNDMEIMREEIFGPVVALGRFGTVEEAVQLANDTKYGLSASIWTKDTREGLRLAGQIDAGTVWINEHLIIFSETPWGGCKESGWGKDLSTMVLEEYTATKHVYVDLTGARCKPWYEILK